MQRRRFLQSLAAAGTAGCGAAPEQKPTRPTNVVFVLTDDQAPNTLGIYNNPEIQTPNCDRLAAGGALQTRAFCTTPVCSPSRATLMTGQIPSQHGIHDWINIGNEGEGSQQFLRDEETFSQILADHGYRVGLSGKWHMGDSPVPQQGFSFWYAMPRGGTEYVDPTFYWNGEKSRYEGYATDVVTDKALEFIDQAKNDPFFCFVSYNAPHTPYEGTPQEYLDLYEDSPFKTFPGEPLNEPIAHPLSRANVGNRRSKMHYYAMISAIDRNVGRIAARLDELGLSENTMIVYLSDHGFMLEHHGLWGKGNTSWPYNMFDESMLVPAFFYQPGRIPAGTKVDICTSFYDFAPTLLDYLGMPTLAERSPKPLAGKSYAPFLHGKSTAWENTVYGEYQYCRMIREESWKYIHRTEGFDSELYDLKNDPGEKRNLAESSDHQPERARLKARMEEWFTALNCGDYDMWKDAKQKELPSNQLMSDNKPA